MKNIMFPIFINDLKNSKIDTENLEINEIFEIKSTSESLIYFDYSQIKNFNPFFRIINDSIYLNNFFIKDELVKELWNEKSRLDNLFDQEKGHLYTNIRDKIFPQDRKGSKKFSNRAGDKLYEINDLMNIIPKETPIKFFDVCGGPGAFSEFLLSVNKENTGYGITLRDKDTMWYPFLQKHNRYKILWGSDDSGNIYNPSNIEFCKKNISKETLQKNNKKWKYTSEIIIKDDKFIIIPFDDSDNNTNINIAVSDGGMKFSKNEKNEHIENYQESYNYRIILSEILLALENLSSKGNFICKIYDCFTETTISSIYLLTKIFEKVFIVKPIHSRIVNSEKYIVCKNLQNKFGLFSCIKDHFKKIHTMYFEKDGFKTNDETITSIVPLEILLKDTIFMNSITEMNTKITTKQTKALKIIMDNIENTDIKSVSNYNFVKKGIYGTNSYKIFAEKNYKFISFYNNIPLFPSKDSTNTNFICEISRGTNTKFKISMNINLNPIIHSFKNDKYKTSKNPYPFNYGIFPQTLENNKPLRVYEVGNTTYKNGEIIETKIIGALLYNDKRKIIAISIHDKIQQINEIEDLEKITKGFTQKITSWITKENFYKVIFVKKDTAMEIVNKSHIDYETKKLLS